jgi:hypothetical protein
MPPCRFAKCAGLAVNATGDCAVHAAGYRQHDDASELRCANCRGLVRQGDWYQLRDNAVYHTKACKVHPDVLAECAKVSA